MCCHNCRQKTVLSLTVNKSIFKNNISIWDGTNLQKRLILQMIASFGFNNLLLSIHYPIWYIRNPSSAAWNGTTRSNIFSIVSPNNTRNGIYIFRWFIIRTWLPTLNKLQRYLVKNLLTIYCTSWKLPPRACGHLWSDIIDKSAVVLLSSNVLYKILPKYKQVTFVKFCIHIALHRKKLQRIVTDKTFTRNIKC